MRALAFSPALQFSAPSPSLPREVLLPASCLQVWGSFFIFTLITAFAQHVTWDSFFFFSPSPQVRLRAGAVTVRGGVQGHRITDNQQWSCNHLSIEVAGAIVQAKTAGG